MADAPKYITVAAEPPHNGKSLLYEMDSDHPGGVVSIHATDKRTFDVGETGAVRDLIRAGKIRQVATVDPATVEPAPDVTTDPDDLPDDQLARLKVSQLVEYADRLEVAVPRGAKKGEIIEAITAARSSGSVQESGGTGGTGGGESS